jgi:hypothetical protein
MKRDYLSASALKAFAQSPNHYLAYVTKTIDPSPAMELGSAIHCAILEPDKFVERYAIAPAVDRRTKEGKSTWQEFSDANAGKTILTEQDAAQIQCVNDAVTQCTPACDLLAGCEFELSTRDLIAEFPFTGIADAFGGDYVVDLKTCRDASPEGFMRDASNLKYHWQATIYRLLFHVERFYWIAAETTAPYNVAVYQQSDQAYGITLPHVLDAIEKFKRWDGTPGSYFDGITELRLPPWVK